MNEFNFIAKHLAPLANGEKGALGLRDDAAVLDVPSGFQLVVTKDAISQGVHFIGDEPAGLIARKLLRVNLSDLAAMGARPWGYFLALLLPASVDEAWLAGFAAGLGRDQKAFSIALMGGDTTRTQGTLSLCLTALGLVPAGRALKRSGAKPGDDVYVSGTLGDGALGLAIARQKPNYRAPGHLLKRYLLPEPRLALGEALRGLATACMDISDGVVQDLGHICAASQAGAEIGFQQVPLSKSARAALARKENPYESVLAGGDDYELLFTAPPSAAEKLKAAAKAAETRVTRIGRIIKGKGVTAFDADKNPIVLTRQGYRHF